MAKRKRELFDEDVQLLKFADYERNSKDCDLLLWEPTTWWGRAISLGTGGPVSHISTVLHCNNLIWSAGLEEASGRGTKAPLVGEVNRWPGKISVFRVEFLTEDHITQITTELLRNLECSYEWGSIRVSALWQIGLFRMAMIFPHMKSWYEERLAQYEKSGAVCSQYIHRSFSVGFGQRMFVKKHAALVTPNDIGMSAQTRYLGTLVP